MNLLLFAAASSATFTAILAFLLPLFRLQDLRQRLQIDDHETRAKRNAAIKGKSTNLRISQVVDKLNLKAKLADEKTYASLRAAGFRGDNPVYIFLFLRLVLPIFGIAIVAIAIFAFGVLATKSPMVKFVVCLSGGYAGFYTPNLYISRMTRNRMTSIQEAWPDALDLTIICVEAGMTVELAFRKVSDEIGLQSRALAHELALTVAELGIVADRKKAYENFVSRVNLEQVRPVAQALIQAERYGTPVGQALRTLSKEAREARIMEGERKAAALPPKLTVPMIIFFLPVLFAFILGPAVISFMKVD